MGRTLDAKQCFMDYAIRILLGEGGGYSLDDVDEQMDGLRSRGKLSAEEAQWRQSLLQPGAARLASSK